MARKLGVFTLTECIEDEREHDEAEEANVELLESGEDTVKPFQALDFVAPLVHFPVVFPWVKSGLERRHHRLESQCQTSWRVSLPS